MQLQLCAPGAPFSCFLGIFQALILSLLEHPTKYINDCAAALCGILFWAALKAVLSGPQAFPQVECWLLVREEENCLSLLIGGIFIVL